MELKIGSHVSMAGSEMFLASVKEALSYNANCLMIYTGAPQNTIRKPIDSLMIKEGIALLTNANLKSENIVVHAPYIINLANPDPEKRAFAIRFLSEEVKRSAALKAPQIVLHPGSAVGLDRKMAINWISQGVNQVISNTKDLNVLIALETMAGKGNEVGKTFDELSEIISLIDDKTRVSVCFDTCHVFDAGYDIVNNYEAVLQEFDTKIGLNKISVLHINDSKNQLASHKDRHENIGFGQIGFETLIKFIYEKRFSTIPKILETPYVNNNAPYFYEIAMIKSKQFDPELKNMLENK